MTFGGWWYDEEWNAHLTDPETVEAAQFYVDLVKNYGEPGAPNAGFSECLTAMGQGNAAMWVDATVAAGLLEDPNTSTVAGKMAYVPAPVVETDSSGWLWAWSLAMPETSEKKDAAWAFMNWATSKEYMQLVGEELGWSRVPPGSRLSTYEIPEYQEAAAAYAQQTLDALEAVNPEQPGVHPQPWVGVQYIRFLSSRTSEPRFLRRSRPPSPGSRPSRRPCRRRSSTPRKPPWRAATRRADRLAPGLVPSPGAPPGL